MQTSSAQTEDRELNWSQTKTTDHLLLRKKKTFIQRKQITDLSGPSEISSTWVEVKVVRQLFSTNQLWVYIPDHIHAVFCLKKEAGIWRYRGSWCFYFLFLCFCFSLRNESSEKSRTITDIFLLENSTCLGAKGTAERFLCLGFFYPRTEHKTYCTHGVIPIICTHEINQDEHTHIYTHLQTDQDFSPSLSKHSISDVVSAAGTFLQKQPDDE